MGFTSILPIDNRAAALADKHCGRSKEKRAIKMATASSRAGAKAWMSMKLPISREAHIKAMMVSLEATNSILPDLCVQTPCSPWWPPWLSTKLHWIVTL